MSHHHHHHSGNIKVAFFLNLGFTIIEIVGGVFTNSMAILADALHDLGDSVSLGTAWYFENLSHKKRDKSYTYGYKRFSVIGAIVNALILLSGSIFIISETIPRLLNPQNPDTQGMIWLAILGIIVNGLAVLKLKKGHTMNEKVVYLHLLEDVLGWVAVLIGAIVMHFYQLPIIDPLLSIGISLFILFNVFKSLKSVFGILMQGVPQDTNTKEIKKYILSLENVSEVHDLHIWSMDGDYNVLTAHVVMKGKPTMDDLSPIKKEIHNSLHQFNINHATLEFEMEDEECVLVDC